MVDSLELELADSAAFVTGSLVQARTLIIRYFCVREICTVNVFCCSANTFFDLGDTGSTNSVCPMFNITCSVKAMRNVVTPFFDDVTPECDISLLKWPFRIIGELANPKRSSASQTSSLTTGFEFLSVTLIVLLLS